MVRASLLLITGDARLAAAVRAALCAPTAAAAGFEVTWHARSAASGLVVTRQRRPDVVLLDVGVAGDVRRTIRALRDDGGGPVLLLVPPGRTAALADLLLDGAAGALETDRVAALPACLGPALAGETVLSRGLVGRLVEEYRLRDGARHPDALLTAREREVLELLRRGRSTAEVARDLGLETVTVRSHVARAVRKLHAATRAEALERLQGPRTDRGDGGPRTPDTHRARGRDGDRTGGAPGRR